MPAVSLVFLAATLAAVADCLSTAWAAGRGAREMNPLLRRDDGSLRIARLWLGHAIFLLLAGALAVWHPDAGMAAAFAGLLLFGGAAVNNLIVIRRLKKLAAE